MISNLSGKLIQKAKKHIDEIVKALKSSSKLILATDPDREGEAISWHILEILKNKKALKADMTCRESCI